ncbi:MAG: SGNH/GDSL hydrolase family protein [Oscillospiraceae bacterium]|nr:SGNH/GDSL hydrolase family protein [Oscillospiraceae bacterium]
MKGVVYDSEAGKYSLCREKLCVPEAEIINRSKMGATVEQGMKLIDRHLESCRDSVVILEYGGNDCNFNWAEVSEAPEAEHSCAVMPERFEKLYTEAAEKLLAAGAEVVISTLPPISAPKFMSFLSRGLSSERIMSWLGDVERLSLWQQHYSEIAEGIAHRIGCPLLPARRAVSSLEWDGMVCNDGLHPNAEGYALLYSGVSEFLGSVFC